MLVPNAVKLLGKERRTLLDSRQVRIAGQQDFDNLLHVGAGCCMEMKKEPIENELLIIIEKTIELIVNL